MLEGQNIICFAPNDWWGMNPSCATHFMRRFARSNRVLFVNPFSSDLLGAKRKGLGRRIWRKLCSIGKVLRRPERNLYVFSPVFLPMQGHRGIDALNNGLLRIQMRLVSCLLGMKSPIVWLENLRAADLLSLFDAKVVIYHVSDLFTKSSYAANRDALEQRERTAIAASDVLVCVSKELCAVLSPRHPAVHYLPHGVDFDLFQNAAQKKEVLEELAGIPKPIAGYFGTMTAHNDIELLLWCAQNLPDVSFVFAGQITGGDYSKLTRLNNIHMLGRVPYEKIPLLCASLDVCMLQWKMDEWIKSCNPLKMFEYMASGRPVVSVPIVEAMQYADVISISQDKEEFCRAIRWELENDTAERRQRRIEIARRHCWDGKAEEMSNLLMQAIAAKQSKKKEGRSAAGVVM
jgi:glycosyltransferase involved in cell wall biosynthesis